MNILYLAHRIPYPPNKGDKIRSYHHLRHLAQRHTVDLISFYDQPADKAGAAALQQFCRQVVLIRLPSRPAYLRGLLALVRGRSLSEGYFGSRAMWRAVARQAGGGRIDAAWAFSSPMAQYLPAVDTPWRVVDYVDVDSDKWRQFAADSTPPLSWGYRLEALRLRAFERAVARWADRALFVSEAEATLFRTFCPQSAGVRVVPNGVDTDYFFAEGDERAAGQPTLLFTGALDYRPNIDAVLFLERQVLPLVRREMPDARFVAAGHRPAASLLREAERIGPAVRVAGSVADIRPYFRQAWVYVAPLRLGRGLQNKILEAMAMRVPVVASPLSLAGLSVREGTHVVVAETAHEFAAAVLSLLRDPQERRRLADAAFRLVRQRYSWAANLKTLDTFLERPAGPLEEETCKVCSA